MSEKIRRSKSFEPNAQLTESLPTGQVAHRDHIAHSALLAKNFYQVTPGVWSFVGNGLSNQSFIDAPDGIIAIDTGESVEEMRNALTELEKHTSRPVVAVLYTHFHYVGGTQAVFDKFGEVPVWGHADISFNRERTATEIAPAYSRGLVEQFAVTLTDSGEDGLVNVGLGNFYRDPAHAPHTVSFIAPTNTFAEQCTINVAGLAIDVTPAPSDAEDSVTYWFPTLGTAVNNLVWPVLFNVFAIRGEEYRDPQVMLRGLDHLLSLQSEHLVGAHGPPISGQGEIVRRVTRYRDSIQFLWDQTVRHTNRGAASRDLAHLIQLPSYYDDDYLTSEYYGVAEHHVRQIRSGLFGFFDGEESNLFPLPTRERADRLIAGFGGVEIVRNTVTTALREDDVRWALECGSWLIHHSGSTDDDKRLYASVLRAVAQRTPSANIRNWCLARARHLDGTLDLSRFSTHRLAKRQILSSPAETTIRLMRVLLVPERAQNLDTLIRWQFQDGQTASLHIRNAVAVPVNNTTSNNIVKCSLETWANIVGGSLTLSASISQGDLVIEGDAQSVVDALKAFDIAGLCA
jgi:alkyl sulfatase BDS1-like metallo-beta-lactamase superfamily hydrolase